MTAEPSGATASCQLSSWTDESLMVGGEHVRSRAAEEGLEIRVALRAFQQRINDVECRAISDVLKGHRERAKPVIRAPPHLR
jgi:hypothetical protein